MTDRPARPEQAGRLGAASTDALDRLGIETPAQYREAVAEVLRLETAREGTADFARRQALRAALADFEQRHMRPECQPGRPEGRG